MYLVLSATNELEALHRGHKADVRLAPSALLCQFLAPPSRCTWWLQEELEALFLQIDKAHGPPSGFILKAELLQALKSYFRVGQPGYKTDIRFEELKEVGALQDAACSLGHAAHSSLSSQLICSVVTTYPGPLQKLVRGFSGRAKMLCILPWVQQQMPTTSEPTVQHCCLCSGCCTR